jgi:hypothetical protein
MGGKAALSAVVLALALLAGGCRSYATQGNAQRAAPEPIPRMDLVYRNSSGVHGDRNTLTDRTGLFNFSGVRGRTTRR